MPRRRKPTSHSVRLGKGMRLPTGFTKRGATEFGGSAKDLNQEYLVRAAWLVALEVKRAVKWSKRIPEATFAAPGDIANEAVVMTDGAKAPQAYAFEHHERHPLNYPNQRNAQVGHLRPMADTPKGAKRNYMSKALRKMQGQMLIEYSKQLDVLVDMEIPDKQEF